MAGRAGEAEPLLRESLRITTTSLADDHWLHLTSRSLPGACLGATGKHPEGEPLVVRSYEGFSATLGAEDPRTRAALDRVVDFYRTWGRADQARMWGAKQSADKPRM